MKNYRMEGNFGGRKIWQIVCLTTFGEIKFGKLLYGACPMQLSFWVLCTLVTWPVCIYLYLRIATISSSLIVNVKWQLAHFVDSVVRGYCEYQSIWDSPLANGDLPCEWKIGNSHDPEGMARKKVNDGIPAASCWACA